MSELDDIRARANSASWQPTAEQGRALLRAVDEAKRRAVAQLDRAERAERQHNENVALYEDRMARWHAQEAALAEERARHAETRAEAEASRASHLEQINALWGNWSVAERELLEAEMRVVELEKLATDPWADRPIPEDEEIDEAFPTRSGRHDLYAHAMRMVGAKRSKGALVALVNMLLVRLARQMRT